MAKAKKPTVKETKDNNKPKCTTHQYGDIIHIYDSGGRYKVRYCKHCREHIIISTTKGNSKDE